MKTNRKNNWTSVAKPYTIAKPTTVNDAGFPAYDNTTNGRALQCVMTGSPANLFYISSKDNIEGMIAAFSAVKDIDFLKKILVYGREHGYTRSAPICGLVVLSTKDMSAFKEVAPRILKNPKDYASFIDLCRSKAIRAGLGRGVKCVIADAVKTLSEYHALKYPTDCKDMINISHAKPTKVSTYLKSGTLDESLTQLAMYLEFVETTNPTRAAQLIKDGRLPFEIITSHMGKFDNNVEVWTALFDVAPHLNLLRNLNTFDKHGVFNDKEKLKVACARISDENAIKKTMTYPFQYYITWANLDTSNSVTKRLLQKALETALEYSLMNVPDIPGNVCVAGDCSGSMSSNVLSDKSVLQCIDLVGLFTAVLSYKCTNKALVLPFDHRIRAEIAGDYYYKTEGIFNRAKLFTPGGGTSLGLPLDLLTLNNIKMDKIIMFTDNEGWVGHGVLKAFKEYQTKVHSNAKLYLVTLLPTQSIPTPPNEKDVYYIYGWSSQVLDLVISEPEKQMQQVKDLVL
jgi:60 kDa SS-A/Ro ribonucleoprotein